MTTDEAFELIKKALEETSAGLSEKVDLSTDLIKDGVVDSLDSMNFLFELETLNGGQLVAIDETFDDFRVETLIKILTE